LRLLSEPETSDYVQRRLKLAGDKKGQIFIPTALERIYLYSQGTPRLINTLCDNAMMSAFALRKSQVTPELSKRAAADLGMKRASANGHSMASEVSEGLSAGKQANWKRPILPPYLKSEFGRPMATQS